MFHCSDSDSTSVFFYLLDRTSSIGVCGSDNNRVSFLQEQFAYFGNGTGLSGSVNSDEEDDCGLMFAPVLIQYSEEAFLAASSQNL